MKEICATCENLFIDKKEGIFRCGLKIKEGRAETKINSNEIRYGCPKWQRKERSS